MQKEDHDMYCGILSVQCNLNIFSASMLFEYLNGMLKWLGFYAKLLYHLTYIFHNLLYSNISIQTLTAGISHIYTPSIKKTNTSAIMMALIWMLLIESMDLVHISTKHLTKLGNFRIPLLIDKIFSSCIIIEYAP